MAKHDNTRERATKDVVLSFCYLAPWKEKPIRGAATIHCFRTNHRLEILGALVEDGLLSQLIG